VINTYRSKVELVKLRLDKSPSVQPVLEVRQKVHDLGVEADILTQVRILLTQPEGEKEGEKEGEREQKEGGKGR